MKRVYIVCEGQTEETFVREILKDHLSGFDVYVDAIVLRTSKTCRGGVTSYGKIKHQVTRLCKQDAGAVITTLLDLYALPSDFPGKAEFSEKANPFEKVELAEKSFCNNISMRNFVPNILLHEYEALLFSDIDKFYGWFDNDEVIALADDIEGADSPEHINESPITAPSKRILRHCKGYDKPIHGTVVAIDIGLDVIREKCSHFNHWLTKLEGLGV